MALSDYNDPVEKIAALKAATLDPALCNIYINAAGTFSCTEKAYMFFCYPTILVKTGGATTASIFTNPYSDGVPYCTLLSGEVYSIDHTFFYVNDADIVYSDPIKTYQKRLAALYTTETTVKSLTETFTSGSNGSILVLCSDVTVGGKDIDGSNGLVTPLPIPAGTTLTCAGNFSYLRYFDVPADW